MHKCRDFGLKRDAVAQYGAGSSRDLGQARRNCGTKESAVGDANGGCDDDGMDD